MRAIADLWVVAIVLGIPLLIIMSVIALAGDMPPPRPPHSLRSPMVEGQ